MAIGGNFEDFALVLQMPGDFTVEVSGNIHRKHTPVALDIKLGRLTLIVFAIRRSDDAIRRTDRDI